VKPHHILILFLLLVVASSQVYVQYWEHRDAPASVRAALLLGGAAILLLALILGPAALRGRKGPAIIPV